MVEVSVLVAVYNAEAYLRTCLDSLLGQTLSQVQVVCIDDCSTDGSPQLLDDYAQRDQRLEVVHLARNLGPSGARNQGLARVKGRYVCMVDADDWLSADALEKAAEVLDAHELTDCVLFQLEQWAADGSVERIAMPDFTALTGELAFRLSLDWQIHGLYMTRTDLQRQYPYDDQCGLYGDENTTRIHYLVSREVRQCSGVYYYRQHPASTTRQVSFRQFDKLSGHESLHRQLASLGASQPLLDEVENLRWLGLIDVCKFWHLSARRLTLQERRQGLAGMRHAWASIDRRALKKETTAHFGYRPCRWWWLFRLQEGVYFTLRGFLGRNG